MQPSLRDVPVTLDRSQRHARYFGGLVFRHPTEETHFHHFGPPRVELRQSFQRFVDCQDFVETIARNRQSVSKLHALSIAVTFGRIPLASVVHQDSPH